MWFLFRRLSTLLLFCLLLWGTHSYAAELTFPLNPNGKVYTNDLLPVNCSFETPIKGSSVECSIRRKEDSDWQEVPLSIPHYLLEKGDRKVVGCLWAREDGQFIFNEPREMQIKIALRTPSEDIKETAIRVIQVQNADALQTLSLKDKRGLALARFLYASPPKLKDPMADLNKSNIEKIERYTETETNVGILLDIAFQYRNLLQDINKINKAAANRLYQKTGGVIDDMENLQRLQATSLQAELQKKDANLNNKLQAFRKYLEKNIHNFFGAKFYPELILMSCRVHQLSFAKDCSKKYYEQESFTYGEAKVPKRLKKTEAVLEEVKE